MYERSTVWITTAHVLQRRHAYIHVFLQLVLFVLRDLVLTNKSFNSVLIKNNVQSLSH